MGVYDDGGYPLGHLTARRKSIHKEIFQSPCHNLVFIRSYLDELRILQKIDKSLCSCSGKHMNKIKTT